MATSVEMLEKGTLYPVLLQKQWMITAASTRPIDENGLTLLQIAKDKSSATPREWYEQCI